MSAISDAVDATVVAAVERALSQHRPKVAVSYEEAAERLTCSVMAVRRLVRDGQLVVVPNTRSITVGSLRALGGLDDLPMTGTLSPEAIDALDAAS